MSPYDYNSIALRRKIPAALPTAQALIAMPLYNKVAKVLGVNTIHDWDASYDKVFRIVEWAKTKSGISNNDEKLTQWIYSKVNAAPSLGGKTVDDVHVYMSMAPDKKEVVRKPTPKPVEVKKVEPKRVEEPKEDVSAFVTDWIKKTLKTTEPNIV